MTNRPHSAGLARLLRYLSEHHRLHLRLVGRYPTGEQGAYAVEDQSGVPYVLKWWQSSTDTQPLERASSITRLLRDTGYPTPRYVSVGYTEVGSYSLQETLAGEPMKFTSSQLLPELLRLNELQIGRGEPKWDEWPARVVETVLRGGDGYCLHGPMQGYSTSTRELLTYLQELVVHRPEVQYRTSDVVHFDYQPANILVHEGRISGVVDWEGACTGDATFDLATLLYYSWEEAPVREELWRRAVERSGTAVLSVYLAHMILRQVDWSIRFYNESTVRQWLQVSDEVLRRLIASDTPLRPVSIPIPIGLKPCRQG